MNEELTENELLSMNINAELMKEIIREGRKATPSSDDSKKTVKETVKDKKPAVKEYSYEGTTPIRVTDHLSAAQWIRNKVWANVDSSNVSKIRYDKDLEELYVQFDSGSIYTYSQVSDHVAAEMFNCPSMGKFVGARLKNVYSFFKI